MKKLAVALLALLWAVPAFAQVIWAPFDHPSNTVNVSYFGVATGNSAADNLAGFQRAIASGLPLSISCGTFLIGGSLAVTNQAFALYGAGYCSELSFTSGSDGFDISEDLWYHNVVMRDLRIATQQQESGTGLAITWALTDNSVDGQNHNRVFIDNVCLDGDAGNTPSQTSGWNKGIVVTDAAGTLITHSCINGRRLLVQQTTTVDNASGSTVLLPSTSGVSIGQVVSGSASIPSGTTVSSFVANTSVTLSNALSGDLPSGTKLTFDSPAQHTNMQRGIQIIDTGSAGNPHTAGYHLVQNQIIDAATCIEFTGSMEDVEVRDGVNVNCGIGVNDARESSRPWERILNSHFNVFTSGIVSTNVSNGFIEGNLIYKMTLSQNAATAIDLESGTRFSVASNYFTNQDGQPYASVGGFQGLLVNNTNNATLRDNKGDSMTGMVSFTGTSNGNRSIRNITQSTLSGGVIAEYADTSTGPNYRSDGNIAVTQITNSGSVTTTSSGVFALTWSGSGMTAEVGQRFRIDVTFQHTYGGTAGDLIAILNQFSPGTATFTVGAIAGSGLQAVRIPATASESTTTTFSTVITCTGRGSINLALQVKAMGSNGTIATNGAQMLVTML